MNEILTCIINAMDQCPKSARFMEQLLANMSKEFEKHGGPRMPSYEEEKKYILGTCPKLPEGKSYFNIVQILLIKIQICLFSHFMAMFVFKNPLLKWSLLFKGGICSSEAN